MEKNTNILLLECFMRGETSPDEEQILSDWLHSQEAKEQLSNYYQETWKGSNNKLIAEVQGRMFERVKSQMHNAVQELNRRKQKRTMRIRRLFQYAAVILLIITAGIGGHLYTVSQTEPTVTDKSYLVQTGKGQRANITLPDGTVVWLNSYTQLHYNANYGATQRVVSLIGEAYFEVAKDKEKPFIVETAGMNVEALGTTFNVKAYREDSQIIATLFSGSVRVSSDRDNVILSPDENATFERRSGKLAIHKPDNSSYAISAFKVAVLGNEDMSSLSEYDLVFNGETLEEIAVLLNRMYNVQIAFKSERIKQYCFSGVICNNSLDNVIELISLTSPITYETRGDTIILGNR